MLPSFSDLTYFYEAANTKNLSQAAKKLGVTQPSLSMAITRLEKSFSTPLFIRHPKGVTLTQSGERLLCHVSDLIHKWHITASSVEELSEEVQGKITIGCHASVGVILNQVTANILEKYSRIEIEFHHDFSVNMTEQIITGNLDIALVTDPIPHPDLIMIKVDDKEMTFWQPIGIAGNPDVIIYDSNLPQIKDLLQLYESGHSYNRLCHANNLEMVAHLTTSGAGIGILPECLVRKFFSDKLERVANCPSVFSKMFLVFRSENKNNRAREVVLTELKNLIAIEKAKAAKN